MRVVIVACVGVRGGEGEFLTIGYNWNLLTTEVQISLVIAVFWICFHSLVAG